MKKQKAKLWIIGYLILVFGALSIIGFFVVKIDPFFHYHKPDTNNYFYSLDNERSQNDGISKHFNYDALITGTSMTENFKTSEMDAIFGTTSIKVPFGGGKYKEINDNIAVALSNNPNLKTIVRGLDMGYFMLDKDAVWLETVKYPTYLYDKNIFNDVKYIFNRNVIFDRVYSMVNEKKSKDFMPGITSFDTYSNWMAYKEFGVNAVCPDGTIVPENAEAVYLSDDEKETVLGNVKQNVVSLANIYPDITFYYFITPYSISWWRDLVDNGTIYKQLEAERLVIEEILKYDNIKLYSFNNLTDITTDLNNYMDKYHYGSWINSLMLLYMKEGKCLITYDNYQEYLREELLFYTTYDYSLLNKQIDYDDDYYAEAMIYLKMNDITPINILDTYGDAANLNHAELIENQYDGELGLQCIGSLSRNSESDISIADYISLYDYIGAKFTIDDISDYKYLIWYGMKNQENGQPSIYIYDENNVVLTEYTKIYSDLDNQWHPYMIDVSNLTGTVTIIFNGGYIDNSGSSNSLYTFSNILLF